MCGGMKLLSSFCVPRSILLRTRITPRSADGRPLTVLGTVVVIVSATADPGNTKSSSQLLYIVRELDSPFICKQCLADLGSIPESFPRPVNGIIADNTETPITPGDRDRAVTSESPRFAACGCPARTYAPEPRSPPCALVENNMPKLQAYLLEHHAASTFKTCEHQPLPLLHGSPLELAVDNAVKPTAHHTPATVPLHWMSKMKSGIDCDVSLGVFEWVDCNTPVSWCHRMVIARKHNGNLRSTVDMQN